MNPQHPSFPQIFDPKLSQGSAREPRGAGIQVEIQQRKEAEEKRRGRETNLLW